MPRESDLGDAPYVRNEYDDLADELTAAGFAPDPALTPADALVEQARAFAAAVTERRAEIERQDAEIAALDAEIDRLRFLADLGRRYHSELGEEALAAGRRAHGHRFDVATYRSILESASLDAIKQMRDDWQRQVADRTYTARAAIRPPVVL